MAILSKIFMSHKLNRVR